MPRGESMEWRKDGFSEPTDTYQHVTYKQTSVGDVVRWYLFEGTHFLSVFIFLVLEIGIRTLHVPERNSITALNPEHLGLFF